MTWTLTNLIIQVIAGIVGGNAVATVAKDHGYGWFGHTATGALGGLLSGYFLQLQALSVVDPTGEFQQMADQVSQWFVQAIAGLVAGAVVTFSIHLAKYIIEDHQRPKRRM